MKRCAGVLVALLLGLLAGCGESKQPETSGGAVPPGSVVNGEEGRQSLDGYPFTTGLAGTQWQEVKVGEEYLGMTLLSVTLDDSRGYTSFLLVEMAGEMAVTGTLYNERLVEGYSLYRYRFVPDEGSQLPYPEVLGYDTPRSLTLNLKVDEAAEKLIEEGGWYAARCAVTISEYEIIVIEAGATDSAAATAFEVLEVVEQEPPGEA